MAYCIYLRKSRADIELEERGEGETLARHKKTLLALARKYNYEIGKIYSEIVSGESITQRPEMQKLLYDLNCGIWQGVLVMEIERLARGDTIDQGIIARVFRENNVTIITPNKVYNPENEFDEEYFEFSLFMSRREYKSINRRIQRGRIASIKEGKYISPTPPFGFDRKKAPDGKGYVLCKNPDEAPVVLSIYKQFLTRHSVSEICNTLNLCGIKPRKSSSWSQSSVRDILKNPANAGYISWAKRKNVKIKDKNSTKISRKKCDNHILVQGMHEGIVSPEEYELALEILQSNRKNTSRSDRTLKNSLSGLVFCKACGKPLSRSSNKKGDLLICKTKDCPTVSEKLSRIEASIICELEKYYSGTYLFFDKTKDSEKNEYRESILYSFLKQKKSLETQLENIYTLVEKGIYSDTEYLERRKSLLNQKNMCEKEIEKFQKADTVTSEAFTGEKTDIFEFYKALGNIEDKNRLLKCIIQKVTYKKNEVLGNVELEIFVKI